MQLYAFSTEPEPEIKWSLHANPDKFTVTEVKNTDDVQGVGESGTAA